MITVLIISVQLLVSIGVSMYSILAYQYLYEGYGLHPAICIGIMVVLIALSTYSSIRLTVKAVYKHIEAHPKG